MTRLALYPNMLHMVRRALTILMIVAVAGFGYRPSLAAMIPADSAVTQTEAAAPVERVAMPDCPGEMEKVDCCDRPDKQSTCMWDSACAARCHVNAGITAMIYIPLVASAIMQSIAAREAQSLVPKPPAPLLRPPIL